MVEEIKGMSEAINVDWTKVFFLNFMYDFSTYHACSGVIIRDPKGNVLHGRNLDFEFFQVFSKLTAKI